MTLLNYTDFVPTPVPVTTGTTVQSYTDPTGEVWVAKNGVAGGNWFRARDVLHARIARSAAWNTATTSTQFSYDIVSRDPFGMFVGGGWQIPISGQWLWIATLTAAVASGGYLQIDCQNGVSVATVIAVGAAAGPGGFTATAIAATSINAAANDTPHVWQRASTAIAGATGSNYTYSTLSYQGSLAAG